MPKTIISDTSCFIVLTNIGELDLLQKSLRTTVEIATEYGEALLDRVIIEKVNDKYWQKDFRNTSG